MCVKTDPAPPYREIDGCCAWRRRTMQVDGRGQRRPATAARLEKAYRWCSDWRSLRPAREAARSTRFLRMPLQPARDVRASPRRRWERLPRVRVNGLAELPADGPVALLSAVLR